MLPLRLRLALLAGVLALCLGSALCLPLQPPSAGMRLISFAPDTAVWMTQEDVDALGVRGTNFMDITEHPDLKLENSSLEVEATIPVEPRFQDLVRSLIPRLSVQRFNQTLAAMSSFSTRYYRSETGVVAANWLADQYRAAAAGRSDITVRTFAHSFVQPSVIARIEGDGSSKEVVIIGGHLDSISSTSAAPGADDDASGSSTVLEVFRVLVESGYKPKRPIEFHGYAGEEAGLLGSQDIAANYQRTGVFVASMLQLDMTCYPGTQGNRVIGVINDFVDPELTGFIGDIIDTYTTASRTPYTCGYACSDHASFYRAGFRSAHPFEAPKGQSNPYMHTSRDTIEKCDLIHAENFLKLGLAYAVEMSAATD